MPTSPRRSTSCRSRATPSTTRPTGSCGCTAAAAAATSGKRSPMGFPRPTATSTSCATPWPSTPPTRRCRRRWPPAPSHSASSGPWPAADVRSLEPGGLGETGLVEDLDVPVADPYQPLGFEAFEHPVDAAAPAADELGEAPLAEVDDSLIGPADEDRGNS